MGSFGWGFSIGFLVAIYLFGAVVEFVGEGSVRSALCWPWYVLRELAQNLWAKITK